MTLAALQQRRDEILSLAARYGVTRVQVYQKPMASAESADVHLLMDMKRNNDMIVLMGLSARLSELLRCRVFASTEQTLPKRIRARVLQDALPL